jgi:nucleotide-binding universal stress UspA family protein
MSLHMVPQSVMAPGVSHPGFDQVVLATDFSTASAQAFHHALKIALASGGRLDIVHAESDREIAGHHWGAFPSVRGVLAEWGLMEAGAPEAAVADILGLQVVKTDIAARKPASALARHLAARPADLVVVGGHTRAGLSRLVHPFVAEPLARMTSAPALFVAEDARAFVDAASGDVSLRRVLIPVDLSPEPEMALSAAVRLCDLMGQKPVFHLLHVGNGPAPLARLGAEHRAERVNRPGPVSY